MVLNQVFIFGGCFAPYCLLAALPHTGVIAFFVSIFFIKDIKDNKQSFNSSINMHKADKGCKEKVTAETKQKLENYSKIYNANKELARYSARQSENMRKHMVMWLYTAETVLAGLKKDDDCEAVKESLQHCFNEIEKIINNQTASKPKTESNTEQNKESVEISVHKNIVPDSKKDNILKKEISVKIRISDIAKKFNLSSKEVISHAHQLEIDVKTSISTLSQEDSDRLIEAIHQKDKTKEMQSDVTLYDEKELSKLKEELESLKSKFQTLVEQKIEYLNNIEEFNREYNLHLGDAIKAILNLKKEILYKKTIKQQKQKAKYKEELQTFEETKETIDELKNTINELEEALKSIDASHENYEEIKNAHEELQEELKKLEDELELQEEALENVKEFIEDDAIKEEYEEAKSHYDEFENDYEQIKQEQKDVIKLDDDEKAELKKLYKKAARLCHPDMVAKTIKDKAHEIMQALNAAYSKKDLAKIKEILHSLESGTTLTTASDVIEDKETLKNKVKEFKNTIAELKGEIEEIQKDDTFQIIAELDDWDAYFEELKSKLNKEKERLEEEAKEVLEESEEPAQETKVVKIKQPTKAKKKAIQKEDKTPYAEHILSIENTNFEKIRRYCNNLVNENQADEMQKYLALNGKMHKALIYDALEQFIAQLNEATITLVDWGCDQGIASMLVLDYIREKQLDIKVPLAILIDSSRAKLSRAITQIEAVSHDEIKIIALKSDDEELLDTLKTDKNNITLNLFANDKMPIDSLDIDFNIFEKDYFMCVSNESKEFVEEVFQTFDDLMNLQELSVRDGKIGRFQRYERIFFAEEKNQDPWDIPF